MRRSRAALRRSTLQKHRRGNLADLPQGTKGGEGVLLGLPALQSELRDKHTDPLFPSPANIIFFCFGLFQLRLAAPLIAAVDTPFRFLFVGSLPVPLPKVAGTPTASTNQSTF